MSQVKSKVEPALTLHEPKQSTALLRKLFNSAQADSKKFQAFSQQVDALKTCSIRATTFLKHLLKDNQFMYTLSDTDVSVTLGDIEYIKLKVDMVLDDVNQSISDKPVEKLDELRQKLDITSAEIIKKYLESVKSLTNLINEKYQLTHDAPREITDYSFIELISDLDTEIKALGRSKVSCKNTLRMRVGDDFGYSLQLNIKRAFSTPTPGRPQTKDVPQAQNFLYPVNYLMILMDELLPDVDFIKECLTKTNTLSANEITTINILNDPYEEIEKILPCTNVIKLELRSSMKFIESMELFLKKSVGHYLKEVYVDTSDIVSDIDDKLKKLTMVLEKQAERTISLNSGLTVDFSTVSETNYIAIHKTILSRMDAVKKQIEILKEICTRQSVSIHPFNLDVLKQVTLLTS